MVLSLTQQLEWSLALTQASAIKNDMTVCEHVSLCGYFIRHHFYVSEEEKYESCFHIKNKKKLFICFFAAEGKLS